MQKPIIVYVLGIYALFTFVMLLIYGIAGPFMFSGFIESTGGLIERLMPEIYFQMAFTVFFVLAIAALWFRKSWCRGFFAGGSVLALIAGLSLGIHIFVVIQSVIYALIIGGLLFVPSVGKYLELEPEDFKTWYAQNRVLGRVKSDRSDVSRVLGIILMIIGGTSIAFSSAYFPITTDVVVLFAWIMLFFGLVISTLGIWFWGFSRIKSTGGIILIVAGILWVINAGAIYAVFYTSLFDDFLMPAEVFEDLREAEIFGLGRIRTVVIAGLVMSLAGVGLVYKQVSEDKEYLASAE